MGRTSTYEEHLKHRGATFGEWLGAVVVEDFGDVDAEYRAAAEDLAVADLSGRGTVVATGTEVVPLLQGVVTSDVYALAEPGSGQRSTAVNAKGRLVCEMRLLHGPDILIMDFEPGVVEGGIVSHFRANVMMEDAKFLDRSPATAIIGVYGPRAAETLRAVSKLERDPSTLPTYHGTWGAVGTADAIVRRSAMGFELLVGTQDAEGVWALFEERGARAVGERALEMHRVEAGIPRWGAELDEKVIPLEAGLDDTIAFDKGCYVGQEIIARLDTLGTPARLLRKIVLPSTANARPGDEVFDNDKKVGDLRSIVTSPRLGSTLALAYLKRDHNEPGRTLQVGSPRIDAQVRPLSD